MNDLIDTIFGDNYISLKCNSGECLHYSQVPGYEVCPRANYGCAVIVDSSAEPSYTRQHTLGCLERFRSNSGCACCLPWYVIKIMELWYSAKWEQASGMLAEIASTE